MSELADRIREYKAANPTLSNAEIGRRLSVPKTTVWNAMNPERVSAYNRARRAAKREWERAWMRSEAGRGHCEQCGGLMGIDAKHHDYKVCMGCKQRAAAERRERVVEMWKQGLLTREIAAELGFTVGHMSVEFNNMRKAGYDLPHRHRPPRKRAAA